MVYVNCREKKNGWAYLYIYVIFNRNSGHDEFGYRAHYQINMSIIWISYVEVENGYIIPHWHHGTYNLYYSLIFLVGIKGPHSFNSNYLLIVWV